MRILSLSICAALAIVPLKHAAAQAADENRKPGPTKEDLRAELARLREALASARRQGDAANERVYLINYPLARLKARKADLLINTNVFWGPVEQVASRELRRGLQALSRLAKGETVDLTKPGILELAYECDVDGTAQPFYVLLPENYDPDRPTPLVVFLHGYVPEINIVDPWVPSETETGAARSLGFIFMVPYGRRNTDFVAVGEVDVLDAIEATKRIFNVASDRIYMMGVSMGGYGTWNIGLRYPHEFAALGPVSGQTDMAAWLRRPFDDMPWWKAWHYRWDNPIELADNAVAIPSHLMWGQDDRLIPVQHGRNMVARLRRLGADVTYVEVPNEDHYIYWGPRVYDATMKWFVGKKRDLWPRHVRYRTWSLRYDTAYWVTIEQFKQWGRDALIDVRVEGDQRINVQAKNVAAYTLRLSDRLLDPKRKVLVVTNDETSFEGLPPADGRLTVCLDAAYRDHKDEGLWKRKGLCGPIEDAYNYPFLIVRGTGDARAAADRFADEWDKYADGKPRVKDASDVTEEDIARYNLVLFGRPNENAITNRMADELPVRFDGKAFAVAGHEYSGDDVGLAFIYPNPLNPRKYVVVYAGLFWGDAIPINHKFDLMPDFIVFTDEIEDDDTNRALCAGFFDRRWQLTDRLTWTREN